MAAVTEKAASWQVKRKGLPPVTLIKEVTEVPKPKDADILIEVHAAALNPVDWKLAAYLPNFVQKLPRTLGSDVSGIVLSHGPNVSAANKELFAPGTRVFGIAPADEVVSGKRPGTLSTHAVLNSEQAYPLPEGWSFKQGACVPLTGLTAFAMAKHAKKGDRVLVIGGSTSVGLFLLQMLKAVGASHVVATASGEKKKIVKERGADEVIDYRETNVINELKKSYGSSKEARFDVILDSVSENAIYKQSAHYLKESGLYYNVGASSISPDMNFFSLVGFLAGAIGIMLPWWLGGVARKGVTVGLDKKDFHQLARKYVDSGVLSAVIDSEFTFDDTKKAYERVMSNRALGKVVVNVKND